MSRELSGDHPLRVHQKVRYLLSNALRNLVGSFCSLGSTLYTPNTIDSGPDSPSRKVINGFFREKLPELINPGNVSVLDIGCGSGYLCSMLEQSGFGGDYLGIDIELHPATTSFDSRKFRTEFREIRAEELEFRDGFDLVVSNTALEHIEFDSVAVQRARAALRPGGIQVHIVPAGPALFLYMFHGYRQYSRCSVRRLMKGLDFKTFRFGGPLSWFVHWWFLSLPVMLLGVRPWTRNSLYEFLSRVTLKLDRFLRFRPHLYCIVSRKEA